jgi:hypothetical protein
MSERERALIDELINMRLLLLGITILLLLRCTAAAAARVQVGGGGGKSATSSAIQQGHAQTTNLMLPLAMLLSVAFLCASLSFAAAHRRNVRAFSR